MLKLPAQKVLSISFLILVLQCVAFFFVDPLGYPDTIRYFNFADMITDGSHVSGDLAFYQGVVYPPLFLPFIFSLLKKFFNIPFEISGVFLQVVSFQAILWLSYLIALRQGGKLAARLTLALLLTQLVFCFRSALILTDYPFTALLLGIVLYVLRQKKIELPQAWVLSFLFAWLISLRTQGMIFWVLISAYLIFSRQIRLRLVAILGVVPLTYLILYFCYFLYLDQRFPTTLLLNGEFSWKTFFFSGDGALQYSFITHGIAPGEGGVPYTWDRFFQNVTSLYQNSTEYYLLFAGALLPALVYSKNNEQRFLVLLILGHVICTLLILTPYYSFVRYQMGIFPLCIILIAGYVAVNWNKKAPMLLALTLLLYSVYFVADLSSYFGSAVHGRYRQGMLSRQMIRECAVAVHQRIPLEKKVMAADTWMYSIIARSGNAPLFVSNTWTKQALEDYSRIHQVYYFIGTASSLGSLADRGIKAVSSEVIFASPKGDIYLARLF